MKVCWWRHDHRLHRARHCALKKDLLKGYAKIGAGTFCKVYEKSPDSPTVLKLCGGLISYSYAADPLWLDCRENNERLFTKVICNHNEVGEGRCGPIYAVEVERLTKYKPRKLIQQWGEDLAEKTKQKDSWNFRSVRWLEGMVKEHGETSVWGNLLFFVSNYGGSLDFVQSNFMVRAGQDEPVFNDLVFDYEAVNRWNH